MGGVLSCAGISSAAQPFLTALLRQSLPTRTVVVVTEGLKTQESFHQDLTTWLNSDDRTGGAKKPGALFYPAWEVLPHDSRLPHADVVSERLETLLALQQVGVDTGEPQPVLVSSVAALLQRTFPANVLQRQTRCLSRGGPGGSARPGGMAGRGGV